MWAKDLGNVAVALAGGVVFGIGRTLDQSLTTCRNQVPPKKASILSRGSSNCISLQDTMFHSAGGNCHLYEIMSCG